MVRGGRLSEVVRNPNYRGINAAFWRNLAGVGNAAAVAVAGTPYCGKSEPSHVIRVGHASPPCRFTGVDVFGGAARARRSTPRANSGVHRTKVLH